MVKGRPKEYKNREIITTSVDGDVMKDYRDICDRERIDYNEPIKEFLAKFVLKKKELHNPQTTLDDKGPAVPSIFATMEQKLNWFLHHKNRKELISELAFGIDEYSGLLRKFGLR